MTVYLDLQQDLPRSELYDQLVDWYKKGDLDFSKITTVNLDEYKGLPKKMIRATGIL